MSIYHKLLEIDRPPYLGGNKWILKDLADITVVFGRNALGKSILLRNILAQDKKKGIILFPKEQEILVLILG